MQPSSNAGPPGLPPGPPLGAPNGSLNPPSQQLSNLSMSNGPGFPVVSMLPISQLFTLLGHISISQETNTS